MEPQRSQGVAIAREEWWGYFRAPRWGFFNRDCRSLRPLRLGLLIMKVPLPWYSAEYSFSFTMKVHCRMKRLLACLLLTALLLGAAEWPLFSEITELSFTRHVPSALINKEQLRRYLEDRVKEIKPADIRAEELTLQEEFLQRRPAPKQTIDDVIRYVRQRGDTVVCQNGRYLVNGRSLLSASELVSRANRYREGRGDPPFKLEPSVDCGPEHGHSLYKPNGTANECGSEAEKLRPA